MVSPTMGFWAGQYITIYYQLSGDSNPYNSSNKYKKVIELTVQRDKHGISNPALLVFAFCSIKFISFY
jgi:hypothetical protein